MNLSLIQAIVSGIAAFGAVYFLIPLLIKFSYHQDLYDKPDDERKLHTRYISPLGGVAIFISLFIGFSLSGYADQFPGFGYFASALVLLFFTGLKDDIMELSPNKKLAVEIFSAMLIMFGCGALISEFGGIFGLKAVPLYISVPLTLLTVVVVMNAFNLIDGVDGLAGGIGFIASLFFAFGFYISGEMHLFYLSLVAGITLGGFLIHNFNPASIFMGDTGSLVIGFLLAFLSVRFIGLAQISGEGNFLVNSAPVLPIAFLAVPLYDTFTVVLKRVFRGDGPFTPGRDHVHHQLLKMGFSTKQTTLYLYAVTLLISTGAFVVSALNINLVLALIILSMPILMPTNGSKRRFLKNRGLINLEKHLRPEYNQSSVSLGEDARSVKEKESSVVG